MHILYIIVQGKYGPTSFITQHASFLHSGYSVYGSLQVTVRLGLSLEVNHTYTYARQILLGL